MSTEQKRHHKLQCRDLFLINLSTSLTTFYHHDSLRAQSHSVQMGMVFICAIFIL